MSSGASGDGYELQDMQMFTEWNVSAIKLDNCGNTNAAGAMRLWNTLIDVSYEETGRRIMMFNSQVGCCAVPSQSCGPEFAANLTKMPEWCYQTSHTWYANQLERASGSAPPEGGTRTSPNFAHPDRMRDPWHAASTADPAG